LWAGKGTTSPTLTQNRDAILIRNEAGLEDIKRRTERKIELTAKELCDKGIGIFRMWTNLTDEEASGKEAVLLWEKDKHMASIFRGSLKGRYTKTSDEELKLISRKAKDDAIKQWIERDKPTCKMENFMSTVRHALPNRKSAETRTKCATSGIPVIIVCHGLCKYVA